MYSHLLGATMKAIAFYLPQYHVIPENEAIYSPGFTEWDNVRSAAPLFDGHYQPHIPHKLLGYYNLLDTRTLIFQHDLAYDHGVEAFCYYYYNLAGKRLLEKPLDIINSNTHIKNSFCLCWDHSSWYNNRTVGQKPFLEQIYSPHEARNLARDLEKYFYNPRYIHINGKPLFLVFAPERHPCIRDYAYILREEAVRMGLPGLCLGRVEAFVGCAPEVYGFDCMVEYAPNWRPENMISAYAERPRRMDYAATLRFMLAKPVPDYPRLRCTFPAWDNTPRRGMGGIVFANTAPELFRIALEGLIEYTSIALPKSMQYIFINAWNEWGEGCHLEPDQRYELQYLHIIREVMRKNK